MVRNYYLKLPKNLKKFYDIKLVAIKIIENYLSLSLVLILISTSYGIIPCSTVVLNAYCLPKFLDSNICLFTLLLMYDP